MWWLFNLDSVIILYRPLVSNQWLTEFGQCLHLSMPVQLDHYWPMSSGLSKYSICYKSVPSFWNAHSPLYSIILFHYFSSLKCHLAWTCIPVCLFRGVSFTGPHCCSEDTRHLWKSHRWTGQIYLIICW